MVAFNKSKMIIMQRIVEREDFVFCKVCNGKHPTTHHCYVRKKVDNTQHQCNNEASKGKKGGEVTAYISLNTRTEEISVFVVPVKLRHALLDSCSQGTFILERIARKVWHKRKENIRNHKNTQW